MSVDWELFAAKHLHMQSRFRVIPLAGRRSFGERAAASWEHSKPTLRGACASACLYELKESGVEGRL